MGPMTCHDQGTHTFHILTLNALGVLISISLSALRESIIGMARSSGGAGREGEEGDEG